MKFNNLRYFLFLFVILCLSFQVDAKMENTVPITYESTIQKKKKLTFKERFILKRLKKQAKKAKHKQTKDGGGSALGKMALGVILSVLGVFGILGAIVSISLLGLIGSIALIVIGALVLIWGVLDVPF